MLGAYCFFTESKPTLLFHFILSSPDAVSIFVIHNKCEVSYPLWQFPPWYYHCLCHKVQIFCCTLHYILSQHTVICHKLQFSSYCKLTHSQITVLGCHLKYNRAFLYLFNIKILILFFTNVTKISYFIFISVKSQNGNIRFS